MDCKTMIIFGAGSAIAQATGRAFLSDCDRFVLVDRDAHQLEIVADDLRARGAQTVQTFLADLSETDAQPDLWNQIIEKVSGPYLVLIAWGTLPVQKTVERDAAAAQAALLTNFLSAANLLLLIANDCERRPAANVIAVISSVAGDRGRKSNYVYGAAKGGLTIFLGGLRGRLSAFGTQVITIKPGFVDTPMTADFKKGLLWARPETIAAGIKRAVQNGRDVVYLPWFWRYIMLAIALVPERIFKKLKL